MGMAAHASIDAANQKGDTALMHAAQNGHLECVGTLLSAGAWAEAVAKNGRTALSLVEADGHVECIEILKEIVLTCEHIDDTLNASRCSVVCTTLSGAEVARADVPLGQEPF